MQKIIFTEEQKEQIANLYQEKQLSIKKIGELYGISPIPIISLLKELKINIINKTKFKSIYTLNEDFFKIIDSEEKAYFLGLLYADGSVSLKTNRVSICLQIEDIDILEKFNILIESDRNIKIYNPPKKFPYRKLLVGINIVNSVFFKHLIDKGCINNKSLVLKFPKLNKLPEDLIHHFIRGYFDGDGSIYKSGGKYGFELIGTKEFIESCQDIMIKELDLNKTTIYFKKNAKNTCRLRYSGNRQCLKIKNWLYKDAKVFLKRKNSKFNEIIASV